MRRSTTLISWVMAVVVTCFTMPQAHAVLVELNLLDDDILVGEKFDVEVWVDGEGIGEDLLGFGFDVGTAGTFFSYTGYTIESGFLDFSYPSNPNNVAGVGATSLDDVLLATLSFSADAAGSDNLAVVGLFDGLFYGLFYEFSGADIQADAQIDIRSAPAPEPATMLLFGSGLLSLSGLRKRLRSGTSASAGPRSSRRLSSKK